MLKQILHNDWTVRPVGDLSEVPAGLRDVAVPARVPGCVHTDLMRAGWIDDPYRDFNEHKLQWIGLTDWQYRTTFDADGKLFDHERIDLVCDGLDTVATIELNGTAVARTENMHRGYRFDVRPMLKHGRNELVIIFASPVKHAWAMREKLGPRPYVNGPAGPFNFIRKMACNFGWDWGPALPTCGIWKGVALEGWSSWRISRVRPTIEAISKDEAYVRLLLDMEVGRDPEKKRFEIFVSDYGEWHGEVEFVAPGRLSTRVWLPKPERWWPRGHGEPKLYGINIREFDAPPPGRYASIVEDLASHSVSFGLRTVELDTSPDDIGRKFVIKVNGKPIFCKGFNWIPDDCFLDRATEPARVRRRIEQAIDAGGNMLRVWGGGIYETNDFYSICDELGVMVWQDFPFACAMYPEEEPFKSEVEAEARDNVARLSSHPSLVIWNGCNENIWGYRDWGWKDNPAIKAGATWGKGYYFDVLPRVVSELSPGTPYWAASPWSGDYDVDNGVPPNADTHGNMHVWAPWFREDYAAYRNFRPRFSSEFGFQAPATYASIASVVPPEQRDFGAPAMRHRQKSGDQVRDDGDRRNLRHLIKHFNLDGAAELLVALEPPEPKPPLPECGCMPLHPARVLPSRVNFDDLHYLLQLMQCRALQLGVEWMRSRQPRCMGTLYWQLNDCWPGVTSWSCIDGDGRPKPLWYTTRRFYAPRLLTIQPQDPATYKLGENLLLFAINDSDQPWHCQMTARHVDFVTGDVSGRRFRGEMTVPPRSVGELQLYGMPIGAPQNPTRQLMVCEVDDLRAVWFFGNDRELSYPRPEFDTSWDGRNLAVRAKSLLRDVCINVDRLDPNATISDQMITLLPGEEFRFQINCPRPVTLEQLTRPPVFQCANRFGLR